MTDLDLKLKSVRYRRAILRIIKQANAGHTAGDLSCIDIINVLYNRVLDVNPAHFDDPDRDRFVMSKGHSVEALYIVLADRGFFPESDLDTLGRYASPYVGHPTRKVHGIEQNTGALGHGLPLCVGMALAARMDGRAHRVYTLVGDGELDEGSNWEASMAAAHHRLDNLVVIVDRNCLQISGSTEEVCALESLHDKLVSFGYAVRAVDGHDLKAMANVFGTVPFVPGKPNLILANTVKGKGISFIENQAGWHHHVPDDAEYARAMCELDAAEAALLGASR